MLNFEGFYSVICCCRIKSHAASKYGLASQPRLVDIIAAVPAAYKKVLFSSLLLKKYISVSFIWKNKAIYILELLD
jgi:histone acetyltransferase (RNA polymerase elongator complex component)